MKPVTQTLTVFLVGLLGGLLGALVFSPADAGAGAAETAESGTTASLSKQLEEMQAQIDGLARSVDLNASSLGRLEDNQESVAQEVARSLAEGVLPDGTPLSQPLDMGSLPAGPGFDNMVAAVIDQREADERVERDARRQERQKEQIDRRAQSLAEELGLDAGQTTQLASVMFESSEARSAMFREMRESGVWDRDTMRSGMEEIRTAETAKLEVFMTPTQVEQYNAQASDFGGWGRGGQRGQNGGGSGDRQRGSGNF